MSDDHIVTLPIWVRVIKIIQAIFSLLVLGFSAYGVTFIVFNAYCLSLFTSLFSLIALAYFSLSLHFFKVAYSWIALLVLECLATVFWLSSMGALADVYATAASERYYALGYWDGYYTDTTDSTDVQTYVSVFKAALAFSVLQLVLYIITLAMLGIGIHQHRSEGKPFRYGGSITPPSNPSNGQVEAKGSSAPQVVPASVPMQPQQQQYYQPPQQYPQQPYPQQQYQGPPQPQPMYQQAGQYEQQPYSQDQSSYAPSSSPYQPTVSPVQQPQSPPPENMHEAPGHESR